MCLASFGTLLSAFLRGALISVSRSVSERLWRIQGLSKPTSNVVQWIEGLHSDLDKADLILLDEGRTWATVHDLEHPGAFTSS